MHAYRCIGTHASLCGVICMSRCRVIAVSNQKGGVGKTTTSVNLAAALGRHGARVLLVDLDPQANATAAVAPARHSPTVYQLLLGKADLAGILVHVDAFNLDLLPSDIDLTGAEIDLQKTVGGQLALRRALRPALPTYDYVIIDTPPSLGLLTVNALATATEVIIPVSPALWALQAIGNLTETVQLARDNLEAKVRIAGILLTMHDRRNNVSRDALEILRQGYQDTLFETTIPVNVKLEEAASRSVCIYDYAPSSSGAEAYVRLCEEVIRRG
jgi:chromosome partitioning protein